MTRIVHQSLALYFDKLRYIADNIVLDNSFSPDKTYEEDSLRFKKFANPLSSEVLSRLGITKILLTPRKAADSEAYSGPHPFNWQVFKGLPEFDASGNPIALQRRTIARNSLKAFSDIHYIFEMDENGDLVFLEPFDIQKTITSFNYEFRDYLRLAKKYRSTSLSEGYISHDQNRTQIITVAAPIFDRSTKVAKVLGVSVSAATIHQKVFKALKESMEIEDGTVFYLVDRHGHIVASSSGKNIYFPLDGEKNDENDKGNLRQIGFFKSIEWIPDVLEKGNLWERGTQSWQANTLKKDYFDEYTNLNGEKVFGSFFPTTMIGADSINWGILIETPSINLIESSSYLKQLFLAVGSCLVLVIAFLLYVTMRTFSKLESDLNDKEAELGRVAAQVAHDIRSPLASLEIVAQITQEIPEDKRVMVRGAVSRIRDIANNLIELEKSKIQTLKEKHAPDEYNKDKPSTQLLSSILDLIITEKRMQFRDKLGIEIEGKFNSDSYGLFAVIQPVEFKRTLSNLINNAVESFDESGRVEIALASENDLVNIFIKDNGRGIPEDIIPKLTTRGATFGKKGGSGLGLYHASQSVASWGGKLGLTSQIGVGTVVEISLPRAKAPPWAAEEICIQQNTKVVVLDDDSSIHQIWKGRIEYLQNQGMRHIEICNFSRAEEIRPWLRRAQLEESDIVFLCDYELIGQEKSGLDIIEELAIASKSHLVTSRYEDELIRKRCVDLGVTIVPKGMAGFVPIRIVECNSGKKLNISHDAVLIDDDILVRMTWETSAKSKGKSVLTFESFDHFKNTCLTIGKDTPVYIDSCLKEDVRGENAAKWVYELGFHTIILATGLDRNSVEKTPWISSIQGKDPPF